MYGRDKVRSILRTLQGSSGKYTKTRRSRAARRRVNVACHEAKKSGGEDLPDDLDFEYNYDYAWERGDRKYNWDPHIFCKWAVSKAQSLPKEDRAAHIKSLVRGKGKRNHWARICCDWEDEFTTNYPRIWWRPSGRNVARRRTHEDRVRLLYEIVTTAGGHSELNRFMVRKHRTVRWEIGPKHDFIEVGPTRPRLLTGVGDIEEFLADLYGSRRVHPHIEVEPYIVRQVRSNFVWRSSNKKKVTWVVEHLRRYREHPDFHPEWGKAVEEFLSLWENNHGDISRVRIAVRGK